MLIFRLPCGTCYLWRLVYSYWARLCNVDAVWTHSGQQNGPRAGPKAGQKFIKSAPRMRWPQWRKIQRKYKPNYQWSIISIISFILTSKWLHDPAQEEECLATGQLAELKLTNCKDNLWWMVYQGQVVVACPRWPLYPAHSGTGRPALIGLHHTE